MEHEILKIPPEKQVGLLLISSPLKLRIPNDSENKSVNFKIFKIQNKK